MFSDKFTPLVKWRTGKTTSHLFGLIINMLELVEFNKRTCFLTQVKLKSFDVICNRFLFHFDLLSSLPTPQFLIHFRTTLKFKFENGAIVFGICTSANKRISYTGRHKLVVPCWKLWNRNVYLKSDALFLKFFFEKIIMMIITTKMV